MIECVINYYIGQPFAAHKTVTVLNHILSILQDNTVSAYVRVGYFPGDKLAPFLTLKR